MDNVDGVWRTVGGRRIFIKDGQDLRTAMKESGKFDNIIKEDPYKEQKKYIKDKTGVSDEEAEEIYGAIAHYTTTSYDDVRNMKNNDKSVVEERKHLEEYISKAPKYEGNIYRGMHFNDDNFVKQLEAGKIISMNGISSWSSDKNIAQAFSEQYGAKNQVIITTKNKSGVDISKLSAIEEEKEVLHSSKSYFNIVSIDKVDISKNDRENYLWNVQVEEI